MTWVLLGEKVECSVEGISSNQLGNMVLQVAENGAHFRVQRSEGKLPKKK